jgi:putative oxidoreductase
MDAGLLIARFVLGLLMAGHGAQKLFGWFGGYGLTGTGGFLESLGFRPGRTFAAAAGGTELVGGFLTAAGLLGPVGPALILSVMIVAAVTVHWHGLFAQANGVELPLLYASGAVALALTGPGSLSLDTAAGLTVFASPAAAWLALAAGIVGAFANLALRRVPAAARIAA